MIRTWEKALDEMEERVQDLHAMLGTVDLMRRAFAAVDREIGALRQDIASRTVGDDLPNPRQLTLHMEGGEQLEFDLRTPQD